MLRTGVPLSPQRALLSPSRKRVSSPSQHPDAATAKGPKARGENPQTTIRQMTPEHTVSGFSEVHGLVMRDQVFAMGIHEAVGTIAVLLDDVVAAIGRLQTQMTVVVATAEQTTTDVKDLKSYTEQEDSRLDTHTQLRIELDRMSSRLESANSELMVELAALQGIATFGGKGGSKGSQRVRKSRQA